MTSLEEVTALYEGAEAFFKETVDIFCNNAGINHTFGWRKCMDIDFVWKHGEKLIFHFIEVYSLHPPGLRGIDPP